MNDTGGVSAGAMLVLIIVLAGLDLIGAILAKEWNSGRGAWLFLAGAGTSLLLFLIYALGLRYAEMSTVTFGWIVGLQVAILLVERFKYGVSLPTGKWLAVVAIVGLQAYLVMVPNGEAPSTRAGTTVDRTPPVEMVDPAG